MGIKGAKGRIGSPTSAILESAKVALPVMLATLLVEFLLTVLLTFLICSLLGLGWSLRLATAAFLMGLLVNLFVSEHVKLTFK